MTIFGVLGAPWTQVGAKGALEKVLGCILGGFGPPFGSPWANVFSTFLDGHFKSKKTQLPNQVLGGLWVNFGSFFGSFFDIFWTMLKS